MKHGSRALGLLGLMVLGMMAFGAGGAQAQLPGESKAGAFLINLGVALLATFTGEQFGEFSLLLVPVRGIEIKCSISHFNEGKINTRFDASAKVEFLECKTFTHGGKIHETCKIKGSSLEKGATIIIKALILPVSHGGQNFVLFEPLEGTSFTTISFEAGKFCPVPLSNPVSGAFVALVHGGVESTLLFSEAFQLLTGDKVNFGAVPAYIQGSMSLELTGAHLGQKLGVGELTHQEKLEHEAQLIHSAELVHKGQLEHTAKLAHEIKLALELKHLEHTHELEVLAHEAKLALEKEHLAHGHELLNLEHEAKLPSGSLPESTKVGNFLVNLGNALLATVSASQIGEGYILVAGRGLEFTCASFHVTEGKINTAADAVGKVIFLGCASYSHETGELLPCELKTAGTITAEALILPIVHGGDTFLLFEPIEGATNLTIISYKSGTGCVLPLNNAVSGSLVAKVDSAGAIKQLILFNENIQLLTADKLTFGTFPSYVIGHAQVELTGSHAGQKLGIH
jgi:hypothetical protein